MRASLDYMRIDHGCFHILVSQQLLNGAYVSAGLQQVSDKGMPQCVAREVDITNSQPQALHETQARPIQHLHRQEL